MKNKSFSRVPIYFFRQRIPLSHPLTLLEQITSYPETEISKKALLENILQWEDDGGRIGETKIPTPEQLPVQPVRRTGHI